MTVNERLQDAELLQHCDAAVASGKLDEMNAILAQVGLRRDASGMHWSLNDGNDRA